MLPATFHLLEEAEERGAIAKTALPVAKQWINYSAEAISREINRLILCRGENFSSVTVDQAISQANEAMIELDRVLERLDKVSELITDSLHSIEDYRRRLLM